LATNGFLRLCDPQFEEFRLMTQYDGHDRKTLLDTLRGTLAVLLFGVGALAFLIAIDRPEWFNLRPASGTAAAMSHASQPPFDTKERKDIFAVKAKAPVPASATAS
jgi:hypothetical protein